jgi:hypothetical protein
VRTQEQKIATKLRKAAERKASKAIAWKKHPAIVRYAKAKYKKGTKRRRRNKSVVVKTP